MDSLQRWFTTNGHCQCDACQGVILHRSDCAVHGEPAQLNAACDCGANKRAAETLGYVGEQPTTHAAVNGEASQCVSCGIVGNCVPVCTDCYDILG